MEDAHEHEKNDEVSVSCTLVPTTIQVIILLTWPAVHDVYEEPDIYAVES